MPMVLALNMMDEVRQNGGSVRVNQMEEALGIPVVPISAAKNEGIDELVAHAIHVANIRKNQSGWISVMQTMTAELFTDVFMELCISLKIMHSRRIFRCVLQPVSLRKGMN